MNGQSCIECENGTVIRSGSRLECVTCHKLYGYFPHTAVTVNIQSCSKPDIDMPDCSTEPPFNPQCNDCEVGIIKMFGSSQRCEHCHKVYGYIYPVIQNTCSASAERIDSDCWPNNISVNV